jgi:hypothetical protein
MKFREFKKRSFTKVKTTIRKIKIAKALNSGLERSDFILFLLNIFKNNKRSIFILTAKNLLL